MMTAPTRRSERIRLTGFLFDSRQRVAESGVDPEGSIKAGELEGTHDSRLVRHHM
jgi:hypothetical protein